MKGFVAAASQPAQKLAWRSVSYGRFRSFIYLLAYLFGCLFILTLIVRVEPVIRHISVKAHG